MLIFNPQNDSLFVNVVWNEQDLEANIFACRHQSPLGLPNPEHDIAEVEHVSFVVNCICQFLWKQLLIH